MRAASRAAAGAAERAGNLFHLFHLPGGDAGTWGRVHRRVDRAREPPSLAAAEVDDEGRGRGGGGGARGAGPALVRGDAPAPRGERDVAPGKMKKMKKIAFAALDASPAAARLAARILPPDVAEVAVADATGAATPLPLADASVAVALSVFAPRRPSELVRVLGERGVVVVVSPGDDHLAELRERGTREALGVLDVAGNKRGAVAEAFVAVGFVAEAAATRGCFDGADPELARFAATRDRGARARHIAGDDIARRASARSRRRAMSGRGARRCSENV